VFTLTYIRTPPVDTARCLPWVRRMAWKAAAHYGLRGSQNLEDLHSAGFVRVLELAEDFSPSWPEGYANLLAAFQGWASREVMTTLQREAARILSGGTIRSPRRNTGSQKVIAQPLSELETEQGECVIPIECRPSIDPYETRSGLAVKHFFKFLHHCGLLAGEKYETFVEVMPDGGVLIEWEDRANHHRATIAEDGTVAIRSRPRRGS
jgi:hypothetical protein